MGLVDNDSGCVSVTAHYTAILLRPFPLEVMDAVVTNAVEVRFCSVESPLAHSSSPSCFALCIRYFVFILQSGFFANVGPLEIFVSRHVSNCGFIAVKLIFNLNCGFIAAGNG